MGWLTDLWNQITQIFTSADMITLIIIAVVVLAIGFMTEGLASLATMTLVALVAFAILQYLRGVTGIGAPAGAKGADAGTLAQTDWHALMTSPVQSLLAYAIAFAVLIAIVSMIRSVVFR